MLLARILTSNGSRRLVRIATFRSGHVPDRRVVLSSSKTAFSPHFRSFSSSNALHTIKKDNKPGKKQLEEVEDTQTDETFRRAIDNNNPTPVISFPGGLGWPFTGSSADAAFTTVIGLGLGKWLAGFRADIACSWSL